MTRWLLGSVFTLAVLFVSAKADSVLPGARLGVDRIENESTTITGLDLGIVQHDDLSIQSQGSLESLELKGTDLILRGGQFECQAQIVTTELIACDSALISFETDLWRERIAGELRYRLIPSTGALQFSFSLPIAEGTVLLEGVGDSSGYRVSLSAENLSLAHLIETFTESLLDEDEIIQGRLSLNAIMTIDDDIQIDDISMSAHSIDMDLNQSQYATAALSAQGTLDYSQISEGHRLGFDFNFPSGEVLAGPLYMDLSNIPELKFEGLLALDDQLMVREVEGRFSDLDALSVTASARFADSGEMTSSQLSLDTMTFPAAFDRYLSSLLQPYGWNGLEVSGELQAMVQLQGQNLEHITVGLTDITAVDDRNRIDVSRLEGLIDYDAQGDSSDSWLNWDDARFYEVPFLSSRADFFAGGRQFQLLKTLEVPLFDGQLTVNELNVNDMGSDDMNVDFIGAIEPISMQLITRALGWPEFSGTLSGEIPTVSVRGDLISVGGSILLDVFDGRVTIDALEIERLLGVLPSVSADIAIDAIDLELLTGTFSFGKIEGRLDGRVTGLRMLDWSPVAFDLRLMTPEKDSGKRRISQRAVNNISSIGGGIAALSNSVLKIFDDFAYSRIGISCRLVNHVCYMGGIDRADRGYYLVKGAGLPRINIIGYSGVVDWPQLLARLAAATKSTSVTVD